MAKRKDGRRVLSDSVQGEGSFVLISPISWGESKELQRQSADADQTRQMELGEQLIIRHVKAWDWVDDAGEPLPLPKDDPAVLAMLTNDEMTFLSKALHGDPNAVSG